MIKRNLHKLRHYLVMKVNCSHIFETHFRWQLVSFLDYFLYPEFRESYKFRKVLKDNKTLFSIIFGVLILFGVFFLAGTKTQDYILKDLGRTLAYKESVIHTFNKLFLEKDKTIEVLRNEMSSRDYIEFKAYRYAKISHFDNFQELPDDEVFLMSEESSKYEIPVEIYYRVPDHESGFCFVKNDSSGASGYFQVMPSTYDIFAKRLGIYGQPHTRVNNIKVGSYLLSYMFDLWKEQGFSDKKAWEYTLCEYYTGKGNMTNPNGGYYIPSYANDYIHNIMKYYKGD